MIHVQPRQPFFQLAHIEGVHAHEVAGPVGGHMDPDVLASAALRQEPLEGRRLRPQPGQPLPADLQAVPLQDPVHARRRSPASRPSGLA
jgi:hypothetical protein